MKYMQNMDMNLQIRSYQHIFRLKHGMQTNKNKVNDMDTVSASLSETEKKNVDFLNNYR